MAGNYHFKHRLPRSCAGQRSPGGGQCDPMRADKTMADSGARQRFGPVPGDAGAREDS